MDDPREKETLAIGNDAGVVIYDGNEVSLFISLEISLLSGFPSLLPLAIVEERADDELQPVRFSIHRERDSRSSRLSAFGVSGIKEHAPR